MNNYLPMITAITGLLGVWFGVFLTERRSYRERAWELKARAYSAIFEALEKMRRSFERSYNAEVSGRERHQADEEADNRNYRATRDELFILIARESWILPDELSRQLSELEKRLSVRHDSYFESVHDGPAPLKVASIALRDFARRDMATLSHSWLSRLSGRRAGGKNGPDDGRQIGA